MANKKFITSADIEDGKTEIDPVTKVKTVYKKIKGGYEVITSTPQPDGTIKTKTQTFYDPIPAGQEFDIDDSRKKTTTTSKTDKHDKSKRTTTTTSSLNDQQLERVDQSRQLDQRNQQQELTQTQTQVQSQKLKKSQEKRSNQETTVEEVRVSQKTEYSGKRVITRKGTVEESVEEDNVQAITEKKDKKKKKSGKTDTTVENDGNTQVVTKKVPGGTEYHYTTIQEDGQTVTQIKTVYDEEESELTEEEIKQYHKHLKEAEKHKDLTAPKTVKTRQGTTKKVIPSENSGEITTVETMQIDGGTEYHYTTVTSDGIVKKSMKIVYDAVTIEENEEEIIEEYEEEIIEPGEPITETIQTTKIVQKSTYN